KQAPHAGDPDPERQIRHRPSAPVRRRQGRLSIPRLEMMALFLQSMVSGILVGGIYALIGIGLTLIFGVMRVINFAQGELVMVGMYLAWLFFTWIHLDPFVSVLLCMPLLFA